MRLLKTGSSRIQGLVQDHVVQLKKGGSFMPANFPHIIGTLATGRKGLLIEIFGNRYIVLIIVLVVPYFEDELIGKIFLTNELNSLSKKNSFTTTDYLIGSVIIDIFYNRRDCHARGPF